jgi:nucleoside 2-deoxyribosyltransferase
MYKFDAEDVFPGKAYLGTVRTVYLAGPIDFAPGDARGWREIASKDLLACDIASFSPAHAFTAGGVAADGVSEYIMAVNLAAVVNADAVLVNLGTSVSVGTSREIQLAVQTGIPVVVISEKQGHYLSDCWVVPNLSAAIEWLSNK